jgi:hypothetical protein
MMSFNLILSISPAAVDLELALVLYNTVVVPCKLARAFGRVTQFNTLGGFRYLLPCLHIGGLR